MRQITVSLTAALILTGCGSSMTSTTGNNAGGRYAGIGVFDAGRLWAQMTRTPTADPAVAKIADDEHIIVVIDSHTGEVRQCGDHSGYCVVNNPWTASAPGRLPVTLGKHAADLDAEEAAAANSTAAAR